MIQPSSPLTLGPDAQIGVPILHGVGGQPRPAAPPLIGMTHTDEIPLRLAALEQRVQALEARTWHARWRRFLEWWRTRFHA
jgi:hypothetical protein